ncbi:MAG: hypothetical protein JW936_06230 [Sedimentisphaerales bacterium]|nr:hypothetical protein [Sedimentisphaerales bacterium]
MSDISISSRRRRMGSTTTATIALAVGLAVCLLMALMYVRVTSGARRRAESLVDTVAQRGLISYFGQEHAWHYYTVSEGGRIIGYKVMTTWSEAQEAGGFLLKGRILDYVTRSRREPMVLRRDFEVANDLSHLIHSESVMSGGTGRRLSEAVYRWEDGLLISPSSSGDAGSDDSRPLDDGNFIPIELLDFFTSLAISDEQGDSVSFEVVSRLGNSWGLLECVVEPGADVPQDVIDAEPQGRAATCTWPALGWTRLLYYDTENSLVWQLDEGDQPRVLRRVSHADLLKLFPDLDDMLQRQLHLQPAKAQADTI